MKLDFKKSLIEAGNLGDTTEFGMELNGKVFKMMTGTLYNDKIGSIVRELSCNALDAHREAGKASEPFTIHLPDAFEPYLEFTDFGIGMSDDDIRKIYGMMFKSTKDQSNQSVGAFGLGSKTPLSYTDNFTVRSVFDGVQRDYLVYFNDNYIPAISKVGECETDACNGVSVQVAIEQSDFHAVKEAVIEQLKFFEVKPKIVNGSVDWHEFENKIELGDLGFISDSLSYWDRTLYFVQGGVGYEVDYRTAREWLSGSQNSVNELDLFDKLSDGNTVIHFDIGEFGVTISRENIEIDDLVKKSFIKRFGAFAKNAKQTCTDILKKDLADLSAVEFLQKHARSRLKDIAGLPDTVSLLAFMGNPCEFKVSPHGDLYFTHADLYDHDSNMNFTVNKMAYKTSKSPKVTPESTIRFFGISHFANNNTFYMIDSTARYAIKSSYVVDQSDGNSITVVKGKDGSAITDSEIKDFERIVTDMTGVAPTIKRISDVTIPKEFKQAKTYTTAKYRSNSISCKYWNTMRDWDKGHGSLDDIGGGVYVPVFNLEAVDYKDDHAIGFLTGLYGQGLVKDMKVYAFNEKLSEKVADDDDWITVSEYADQVLAKSNLNKHKARLVRKRTVDTIKNALGCPLHDADIVALNNINGFDALTKLVNKSELNFKELHTWGSRVFEVYIKGSYSNRVFHDIDDIVTERVSKTLMTELEPFRAKFPLLQYIRKPSQYSSTDNDREIWKEHIIQYVNCVK